MHSMVVVYYVHDGNKRLLCAVNTGRFI